MSRGSTAAQRRLARAMIGIAAVVCSTATAGGAPLTRARAVEMAVRENPRVAAARARVAQARAQKEQADAGRWPQVTLDLFVGPSLRAELVEGTAVLSTENRFGDLSFDDLSAVFGGRLNVQQPLYTFGKIDHRRDAAAHGIDGRNAEGRMTRAEVAVEVARAYEGLLFAREAVRFLEGVEERNERALEQTRALLEADVTEILTRDVLRFEAALGSVRIGLHQVRAAGEQARAGLAALLGLDAETLELSEPALEPIDVRLPDRAELVATARRKRPELAALSSAVLAFEKLTRAERAGIYPDLFLFLFVHGAYTPGRDLVDTRFVIDPLNHFDPGLFAGLRWRYQPGMVRGRAAEQEARAEQYRHLGRWALQGMSAEVRRSYEDLGRARRDLDAAREGRERAAQWVRRASAEYSVGLARPREVTDALEAYARLGMALLDAARRHNVALAELSKATGTLEGEGAVLYPGTARRR